MKPNPSNILILYRPFTIGKFDLVLCAVRLAVTHYDAEMLKRYDFPLHMRFYYVVRSNPGNETLLLLSFIALPDEPGVISAISKFSS